MTEKSLRCDPLAGELPFSKGQNTAKGMTDQWWTHEPVTGEVCVGIEKLTWLTTYPYL